jgi:uncharacterized sulfatase
MADQTNPFEYQAPKSSPAPGVHVLPGMGNALAVETDRGVVLVDSGPGGGRTRGMIESLRQHTQAPVLAICYSHGHGGYNAGVPQWLADAKDRGDPSPRLIAHENLVRRYGRYRETEGLQKLFAELQFRLPLGSIERLAMTDPTETFSDSLVVTNEGRTVELLWAPSETDDAIALWLSEERVLYGGAAVIPSIPNVGTPLRTLRDTVRWAETLERLAALDPVLTIREFGPHIEGRDQVQHVLLRTADALRWIRSAVVDRLNRGMNVEQIVADIEYPPELFEQPWMLPIYGDPEYIVRDICRSETGWWDRNPTTLHPSPPDARGSAVLSAISDRASVIERARTLASQGDTQLALHVIDLLALAPGDDPDVVEARRLKGEWARERAKQVSSFVSRSLYSSSAALIEEGKGDPAGIR